MLKRLESMTTAILLSKIVRTFQDLVFDEMKHPRGPNGRFIGGDHSGKEALQTHFNLGVAKSFLASATQHANEMVKSGDHEGAKLFMRGISFHGRVGASAIINHINELEDARDMAVTRMTPSDAKELLALAGYYNPANHVNNANPDEQLRQTQQYQHVLDVLGQYNAFRNVAGKQGVGLDITSQKSAMRSLDPAIKLAIEGKIAANNRNNKPLTTGQVLISASNFIDPSKLPQFQGVSNPNYIGNTRLDQHGTSMPFTVQNAVDAYNNAPRYHIQGVLGDTRKVEINGQSYFVKADSGAGQRLGVRVNPEEDARNEAAVVAGAKVIGSGAVFASGAWHVIGPDGRQYTISAMVNGKTAQQLGAGRDNARTLVNIVPESTLQRSLITEYLFGIADRHEENVIIDPSTHTYINIDNSFAFGRSIRGGEVRSSKSIAYTALKNILEEKYSLGMISNNELKMAFSKPIVQDILNKRDALIATLSKFGLSYKEMNLIQIKLNLLENYVSHGRPMYVDEINNILPAIPAQITQPQM